MQRIATTNKATDLFGPGKHGFRDGNPSVGIYATEFSAQFCNDVQEEICGIIEAAGIALDPNNRAQLLAALRAAGVFQTPAQFDNTTKAATTEFVQRALGSLAGGVSYSSSAVIPTSAVGKLVDIGTATPAQTFTLPSAAQVPVGGAITIQSQSSVPFTVQRGGTDTLSANGAAITSLIVQPGDSLVAISNGSSVWNLLGIATLQFSGAFGASFNPSGYQKLPSGLIIQWGRATFPNTGLGFSSVNLVFPLAFPAGLLYIGGNSNDYLNSADADGVAIEFRSLSLTSFTAYVDPPGAAVVDRAVPFRWLALGY